MHFLPLLFLIAGYPAVHGNDIEASTDAVGVEFLGASGGLKIFPKSADIGGAWIMVQQDKLEEVTVDGKRVNGPGKKMNMAGQNMGWTPLAVHDHGDGLVVHSTSFTKVSGDVTFKLTAHLAKQTTTVQENVPCNNCTATNTGADCQNTTTLVCAAAGDDGTCAEGFTRCTETVKVTSDQLKFSIVVQGWEFADASNLLSYGIDVKSKNGGGAEAKLEEGDGADEKKVALDGGMIYTPTKAVIKGGETDVEVDVDVRLGTQGSKQVLTFTFPAFGEGEALYYDPDLSVPASGKSAASSLQQVPELATALLCMCVWALLC